MWIDIHAHLFDYSDESFVPLLQNAKKNNVGTIITTATDYKTSRLVIDQCARYDQLYGAVGISPFDIEDAGPDWESRLQSCIGAPRIIALGEIGLDNSNPRYPAFEKQISFFEKQLTIARDKDLPAIIHSRGAEKTVLDTCKSLGLTKVLFHCFTGERDIMEHIIDAGYYISLSGIVTFKKASFRSYVSSIPTSRLFIETDTPYLTPVPYRGKQNQPAYVRYVGEEVARLLEIDPKELQNQIEKNFSALFLNR